MYAHKRNCSSGGGASSLASRCLTATTPPLLSAHKPLRRLGACCAHYASSRHPPPLRNYNTRKQGLHKRLSAALAFLCSPLRRFPLPRPPNPPPFVSLCGSWSVRGGFGSLRSGRGGAAAATPPWLWLCPPRLFLRRCGGALRVPRFWDFAPLRRRFFRVLWA